MSIERQVGQVARDLGLKAMALAILSTLFSGGMSQLLAIGGAATFAVLPKSAFASSSPSASGTAMPSASRITDSQGNTWTLISKGDLAKNGVRDGSSWNVALMLFYQGVLYQENTSHAWYAYNGSTWRPHAGGNPSQSNNVSAPPTSRLPPPLPTNSDFPQRSITEFGVECNGTDQFVNVQKAFNAAANNAFELVVDCPVTIHTARLSNKTVFVGSDITVTFTSAGVFYVDNVLQPAFAIMNSSNVTFLDWNIVYTGSLGVALADHTMNIFNDENATSWLRLNRHINFESGMHSVSQDTYNSGAMFFIVGDDSNIVFSGFHITAQTVLAARGRTPLPISAAAGFVPCVFTLGSNFKSGTAENPNTVRNGEKLTSANSAGPSNITFENITLDGTIMGFVGSGITNSSFTNITSIHYSDVQDVNGNHIGGDIDPSNNSPWTPPPHLFYFVTNTQATPTRPNANLTFNNINDANLDASGNTISYDRTRTANPNRVGGPRDTVAILQQDHRGESGFALSMKLECGISAASAAAGVRGGCTVNKYTSYRPDGFLAVQDLNTVTFSNVTATFDSNYTGGLPMYRPGIWFPGPYSNLSFKNVTLTDVAAHAMTPPIGYSSTYYGLNFEAIDPATRGTGVNIYVNSLPENGLDLYDNNAGQTVGSTRYYYVGNPMVARPLISVR